MVVIAKNLSERELSVKAIVEQVLTKFSIPQITSGIIIEEGAVPHSHPVLTLGTRVVDPLILLKTIIHEEFHWFVSEKPNYTQCIEYLKKYPDLGDCNKTGNYPDSFWEHLVVCWNTRNYLQCQLKKEEVEFIYNQWQPYPLTEKFVKDNFMILENDLTEWGMIYPLL